MDDRDCYLLVAGATPPWIGRFRSVHIVACAITDLVLIVAATLLVSLNNIVDRLLFLVR